MSTSYTTFKNLSVDAFTTYARPLLEHGCIASRERQTAYPRRVLAMDMAETNAEQATSTRRRLHQLQLAAVNRSNGPRVRL